jgi:hypothetical protein
MAVSYWLQGYDTQNFGDFLSEYLLKNLALHFESDRITHLIGSVIADEFVDKAMHQGGGPVVFWGCGARSADSLRPELQKMCEFRGVRGPLTRDALGLPGDTVLGDPALLLPLFHPAPAPTPNGKRTICVPHILDPKTNDEIADLTGVDHVLRPEIRNDLSAVEEMVNEIASADFVLSGALHAAIVASAYDVPYCFFDGGFIDLPFKYRDFSASVGTGTYFVQNLEEGRLAYKRLIAPFRKPPPLLPLLSIAPFTPIERIVGAARSHDENYRVRPRSQRTPAKFREIVRTIRSKFTINRS